MRGYEEIIMKKIFENIHLEIIALMVEDVIRTSSNDNIESVPEFPENFQGN